MSATLVAKMLTIADREATFARRRFSCVDPAATSHLEAIGKTFLRGYRAALGERRPGALADLLDDVPAEMRGFAFEGAGMALALLDSLLPWRRRLRLLLAGRGRAHRYMLHVGAGWARARLLRRPSPVVEDDPLLGWLAVDGFGFHQGYFRPGDYVANARPPARARGYAARAFDQGLGRSLWFVCGADPHRAASAIDRFPPQRQPDLWSGLGLAAAYAGGASGLALDTLRHAAGPLLPHAAQGAAFAAAARFEAGNPAGHTTRACEVFCGCGVEPAVKVVNDARDRLSPDDTADRPRYETWRQSVRAAFEEGTGR
jgi:hypothetical protein